jgi:uncharacterized protein
MALTRLPQAGDLLADVRAALFTETPDLSALESRLTAGPGLSGADAQSLIYQVVLQLNRRLFPPVTKLELIHTEGCNLACTYCFEKNMLGVRKMSPEVMRAAIDLLLDYSGDSTELNITHFGGEPTLNFPAIRAATEYVEEQVALRGKTITFDMTSNGVLIDEEIATYCAQHRIMVLLSIDGLEASHDRFRRDRGDHGTFARAMRALRILKGTQGWVGVKMTVMPENAGRLYEDVTGLYALGVNQFIIGYATGITWPAEAMQVYSEQLARVYQWYAETPQDNLRITEFEESDEEGAYFGCQAGRNSMTAAVNGEISPCSKILALDNKNLLAKLGDVHYGLTHLKNRQDLVSCAQLYGACVQQGIAHEFQGGCFASNYEGSGNLFIPNLQDHAFSLMKRSICAGCSAHGQQARSPGS